MSTSFHPQIDGASERSIRLVAQILQVLIRPDQQDWLNKIPMVEFALNSAISNLSGFALFELNYGYMPSMNLGIIPEPSKILGVKYFITCIIQTVADATMTNFRMETWYMSPWLTCHCPKGKQRNFC